MINGEGVFESDFEGPIVLHMIDQKGYGDVSLGMKVAKFLMKKYPDAPIFVLARQDSLVKIEQLDPGFFDQGKYPQLQVVNSSTENVREICDGAKLAVETAIFDDSFGKYHRKSNCPRIFIGEYGLYERKPYEEPIICLSGNVGKGKDYPGILIEPDLKEFSKLDRAAKQEARGEILRNLDSSVKQQVLHGSSENITSFMQKNNFAFSYFNFPISYKRAATVFAASNEVDKHANYFVSASAENNKDKIILDMLKETDFQNKLKELGYTKLVFYTGDSEEVQKEIVLDSSNPEGREFRVFQRSRFTLDTTKDLMCLSDICGVAGDQSLTEAYSLGAFPIPEEWHCQIRIIEQIAETYYTSVILNGVHNNTWGNRSSVNAWAFSGELLRENTVEVGRVLHKIQEESNLYNALDYRLNLEFDKPRQDKVDQYNKDFIETLERYQRDLPQEEAASFDIAIQIARYYAQHNPGEPLMLRQIIETMRDYEGQKITHIDAIREIQIQKHDCDHIGNEQSDRFIKGNMDGHVQNKPLLLSLQSLYNRYLIPERSNAFKDRFSEICHRGLSEEDINLAVRYLSDLDLRQLTKEIGFGRTQHRGVPLDGNYHMVENLYPCEEGLPLIENKNFTIILETDYSTDPSYKVVLSKSQIQEFAARQKDLEVQATYTS